MARPWMFALIAFPVGIPTGFLTVAFPFLATEAGMPLAAVGAIVGTALFANTLTLLWTPIADITLTLRRWAAIGCLVSAAALVALVLMPLRAELALLIGAVAFVSQAAATLPAVTGGALMAVTLDWTEQGRGAGYWQAGVLFSSGLGGGAGLWLAIHAGAQAAGVVTALLCLPGLLAVAMIREPERRERAGRIFESVKRIGLDLWSIASSRRGLLAMTLICTPIGIGAASFLWGGIAGEWGAGPGLVALVTGFGAATASALGAMLFGRLVGKADRMLALLATGTMLAGTAILLALLPRNPTMFAIGTLSYAVLLGASYGAFTALILDVIGTGAAATKFAALYALGNIPVAYMPALNGWVHDRWSTGAMLWAEAGLGLIFVLVYLGLHASTGWRARSGAAHAALAGRGSP